MSDSTPTTAAERRDWLQGYEFALRNLSDEAVQADLARVRAESGTHGSDRPSGQPRTVRESGAHSSDAARRLPVWLVNLLTLTGILVGGGALVGLGTLFDRLGWTVAKYVVAVLAVVYLVFAALALIGYLLYLMDQEVRRGLKR